MPNRNRNLGPGFERRGVVVPFPIHQVLDYLAGLYLLQVGSHLRGRVATVCYGLGAVIILAAVFSGRPLGGGPLSRTAHRLVDIALIAGVAAAPFLFDLSGDVSNVVRFEGLAVVLFLLVAVAPLRRAVAFGTSRVILWAAAPITPFVPDFHRLPDTTRVLAADGSELAALSGDDGRRQVLELDAIPEPVRRAVLAAEDADFYHHSGVNPLALVRAVAGNALGHTQGGSTITQQLAKLNYTGSSRTVF